MARVALSYINYIPRGDGTYVDFKILSEQEKAEVRNKITTRMMETLGYKKVIQEDENVKVR